MLITIVTINRNNAEGLERTIRSVLEQADRATFEYVVIDGASTDGSLEVIDKYKEQLDFHLSEPDHGIYNAMNKSLEHVHGKYVLFLNSGDTLASTDVIRQVTNYGLTADIYFGFWRKTSEDKKYKIEGPTTPVTLYELQYNSRVCHQATITATSTLRELGGYNEHYRLSADAIFLMQALVLHRCTQGLLPIVIANYDICGVSASNDDKLRAEHAEAFSTLFPALVEDYEQMHSWMRFHPKNMIRHIRWRWKKIFS